MNMIPRHADATLAARLAPPHSTAFVQMHSGFCVDLMAPNLDGLTLTDLATGLSRTARFNGATRGPRPYTVAQHSVFVSQLLERRRFNHHLVIAGLLHDAHEAIIGDIATPVKIALGRDAVHELEARLQAAIARRFGLGPFIWANYGLHHADADALATERRDLMAPSAWPWPASEGEAQPHHIEPWPEAEAFTLWAARAARLGLR